MLLVSSYAEPILVTNPRTGAQINVAPLFDAMDQLGEGSDSPADLRRVVGKLIVVMGRTVHDPNITPPERLANINYDLFRLFEMFSRMESKTQAA